MAIFLLTLALFLLSLAGLAVGVMVGRPAIKGSCGGLACIEGGGCGVCPRRRDGGRDR